MEKGKLKRSLGFAGIFLAFATSMTLFASCSAIAPVVSELSAHPADGAVVLNWKYAESGLDHWRVYCDGEIIAEPITNYYVAKGLVNGSSHQFEVASVNGNREGAKSAPISCSPKEGASYNVEALEKLTPLEEKLTDEQLKSYLGSSLLTTGNNHRVKRFLEKIGNGEEATVGYFGGSITVGRNCTLKNEYGIDCGYAYNSFDYLRNYYAKNPAKLNYVNAAISGTATETGIVRIQEDLLDHNPDLVFVEFAANNSNSSVDRETFDSCVRKILSQPNEPAVIIAISATYYTGGAVTEYIQATANEYDLPIVSIDQGLKSICKTDGDGMLNKDIDSIYASFIDDNVHPNNQGHRLYAKAVDHLIDEIAKEEEDLDPAYNLNMGSRPYDNFHGVNMRDDVISVGSWEKGNTVTPAIDQSMVKAFGNGYLHKKGGNDAFELNVYARNFILEYRCYNPHLGLRGTIVIDYKKAGESKTNTITCDITKNYREGLQTDGWDNPVPILLFEDAAPSTYVIKIYTSSTADEATIFSMGYSD